MSSAIPSQFIAFHNFRRPSLMVALFLGGFLTLIPQFSPAQTPLPGLPPNIRTDTPSETPTASPIPEATTQSQESSPQQQPNTAIPNSQPQPYQTYQAVPFNQNNNQNNNQNQERYLVFVDSNNYQVLEQVRLVEPRAYIRQIQGRSIIQVGVFSKAANAQQRLNQLTSSGINGARAVSLSGGQPTPNNPNNSYNPNPGNPRREESNYYYVAIPANSGELASIQDKIRRNLGQSTGVIARNHPLGSHVAVGPFAQRLQAEQWNSYLRNLGFGNARVYYGK
ncbi:MAG: SPOR domain-containing protein [Heteroscytonema crispum UTEX LB 1556]